MNGPLSSFMGMGNKATHSEFIPLKRLAGVHPPARCTHPVKGRSGATKQPCIKTQHSAIVVAAARAEFRRRFPRATVHHVLHHKNGVLVTYSTPPLAPIQRMNGPYKRPPNNGVIGEGTFGKVYALCSATAPPLAFKEMTPSSDKTREATEKRIQCYRDAATLDGIPPLIADMCPPLDVIAVPRKHSDRVRIVQVMQQFSPLTAQTSDITEQLTKLATYLSSPSNEEPYMFIPDLKVLNVAVELVPSTHGAPTPRLRLIDIDSIEITGAAPPGNAGAVQLVADPDDILYYWQHLAKPFMHTIRHYSSRAAVVAMLISYAGLDSDLPHLAKTEKMVAAFAHDLRTFYEFITRRRVVSPSDKNFCRLKSLEQLYRRQKEVVDQVFPDEFVGQLLAELRTYAEQLADGSLLPDYARSSLTARCL